MLRNKLCFIKTNGFTSFMPFPCLFYLYRLCSVFKTCLGQYKNKALVNKRTVHLFYKPWRVDAQVAPVVSKNKFISNAWFIIEDVNTFRLCISNGRTKDYTSPNLLFSNFCLRFWRLLLKLNGYKHSNS